jgi:hypothetical protein
MVSWQEVRDEIVRLHNQRVAALIDLASDPIHRYSPSSADRQGWAEDLKYEINTARADGYTLADGRVFVPKGR